MQYLQYLCLGNLRIPRFRDIKPLCRDWSFIAGLILLMATAIAIGYLEATQEIYFSKVNALLTMFFEESYQISLYFVA